MLAATVETMRRIHAIGFVLGAALTGLTQQASAADMPPAASSRTESTQPEWSAQLLMVSGWTTGVYADSSNCSVPRRRVRSAFPRGRSDPGLAHSAGSAIITDQMDGNGGLRSYQWR